MAIAAAVFPVTVNMTPNTAVPTLSSIRIRALPLYGRARLIAIHTCRREPAGASSEGQPHARVQVVPLVAGAGLEVVVDAEIDAAVDAAGDARADAPMGAAGLDADHLRAAGRSGVACGDGWIRFVDGIDEGAAHFGNDEAAVTAEAEHLVEAEAQRDVHAAVVAGVEAVANEGRIADAFGPGAVPEIGVFDAHRRDEVEVPRQAGDVAEFEIGGEGVGAVLALLDAAGMDDGVDLVVVPGVAVAEAAFGVETGLVDVRAVEGEVGDVGLVLGRRPVNC